MKSWDIPSVVDNKLVPCPNVFMHSCDSPGNIKLWCIKWWRNIYCCQSNFLEGSCVTCFQHLIIAICMICQCRIGVVLQISVIIKPFRRNDSGVDQHNYIFRQCDWRTLCFSSRKHSLTAQIAVRGWWWIPKGRELKYCFFSLSLSLSLSLGG